PDRPHRRRGQCRRRGRRHVRARAAGSGRTTPRLAGRARRAAWLQLRPQPDADGQPVRSRCGRDRSQPATGAEMPAGTGGTGGPVDGYDPAMSALVSHFQGFPRDGIPFFFELQEQQSRTWFAENRKRFDRLWADPLRALVTDLAVAISDAYPGLTEVRPHFF